MVNIKSVSIDPVFTIEKQCDRCRNVLYFADSVITDVQTDEAGQVLRSSVVCPVCGHVIVLYEAGEPPDEGPPLDNIDNGEEA